MLTTLALTTLLAPMSTAAQEPNTIPANLVGEWRYTSIRGVTYWDTSSNAYLGHGGGNSSTYIFAKNGTFKEYVYMENSPSAGWKTKIFTTKEGRVKVVGQTLELTVTKGQYKAEDNRVASYNIDRAMTKDEAKKLDRTYRFSLATEGDKRFLTLALGEASAKGSSMKYEHIR